MLVIVLIILVTNIQYLFTKVSVTNIQKIHQDRNSLTNIQRLSPTLRHPHHCHQSLPARSDRFSIAGEVKFPNPGLIRNVIA